MKKLRYQKEKVPIGKKIALVLASHSFLIMLVCILVSLLLGVFLFYTYAILAETKEASTITTGTQFNYQAYQQILQTWQHKQDNLAKPNDTTYSNPFIGQ